MDAEIALMQAEEIGYPLFVKPVGAGSSYGITKVTERNQLPAALKLAFSYDNKVIIEECISGFEVGCAVLENDGLMVGEVDEIELEKGFSILQKIHFENLFYPCSGKNFRRGSHKDKRNGKTYL